MVTDEQILSGLETLLSQADFSVTTSGDIRQQLEHKLGVDLSHKRAFIREHIDLIVQSKRIPYPPYQQQHHRQHQPQFQHLPQAHGHGSVAVGIPSYGDLVDMPAFDPKVNYGCSVKVDIPQGSVAPEMPKDSSAAQVQNSTSTGSKRKGGTGGLNKLCGVSPELQVIVGEPAMPRTQIVKQLWAYIRRNNLQDPSNKRKIICNDALRLVFETDCTDMFKMNKLLAKHILPLEPAKDAASDLKSLKATCSDSQVQGVSTGSVPVIMSEALTDFFGNGERELPQQETLKRIWNYIQMNHLEDPLNSVIVCDYRLRELFSCEKFAVGNLPDMLSHHYLKK